MVCPVANDLEQLSWAAGFIDGDGTISNNAGRYVSLHAGNTEHELLLRLQQVLQCGNVTGPYDRSGRERSWSSRPQYFFQAYVDGAAAVSRLWFALSDTRRQQALDSVSALGMDACLVCPPFIHSADGRRSRSRLELAWAAGFFDAEGCFSSTPRVGVCATITQTDQELLKRFRHAVDFGKIYGPYRSRVRDGFARKPHYFFRAHGNERVQAILSMLWPWLGATKRRQAIDRLAWTTTCRNGHPKKPGHTGCGECTKAYWAARRQKEVREPAVPYLPDAA
jgi:hypothetical protein